MRKISSFRAVTSMLIYSAITLSFPVTAAMYKWVDENGNTHYSQSPPTSNVEVETIKPPSKVDTEGANKQLEKQRKDIDKLREDRLSSAEEAKKKEAEKAQKKQECDSAKKRLASYQRPRVNKKNADGSLTTIPEAERQAEIKKSRETIKKACN